jgi:hypothetical protein
MTGRLAATPVGERQGARQTIGAYSEGGRAVGVFAGEGVKQEMLYPKNNERPIPPFDCRMVILVIQRNPTEPCGASPGILESQR